MFRFVEGDIVLYSASGAPISVINDSGTHRLETRTAVIGQTAGAGSDKRVTVIDDTTDPNVKRIQTEALIAPGSTINLGTSIPSDPGNLVLCFFEDGGTNNLLVDGSTTPVVYSYEPPPGVNVAIDSILFVFTADEIKFDGDSFGPEVALTNGVEVGVVINSVPNLIFTVKQNEDFLRVPGRVMVSNTGIRDMLSSALSFGGALQLDGDLNDNITVTINDNLTGVRMHYFTATLYGVEI